MILAAVSLSFLNELVVVIVASVVGAYVCYRIGLVSILGFLLAGVVIGPHALGWVQEQALIDILAELGVILLLFAIGVELSIDKMSRLARAVVIGGGLQVAITSAVVLGLGLVFGLSWTVSLYTGFLVALSSTALVLGLLEQKGRLGSPTGQNALAILIFQDIIVVVMVLLVPVLAGETTSALEFVWIMGKALLLTVGVLVVARRLVPHALDRIAGTRNPELLWLTILGVCAGVVALAYAAGLSPALGAFLGGLLVSETRYREQALADTWPLRVLFTAIFFVSVGMLLDVSFFLAEWWVILAVVAGVMILKTAVAALSVKVLRYDTAIAAGVGLTLAQVGEFSFVLERVGDAAGLSPFGLGAWGQQVFIASTVGLLALTPLSMAWGERIQARVRERSDGGDAPVDNGNPVVIVVGYGPGGQGVVRATSADSFDVRIVEVNPATVAHLKSEGRKVIFGDATRRGVLQKAGLGSAILVVIAISDMAFVGRVIELIQKARPDVRILARVRYQSEGQRWSEDPAITMVIDECEARDRLEIEACRIAGACRPVVVSS